MHDFLQLIYFYEIDIFFFQKTVLFYAVETDNIEIIQLLISHQKIDANVICICDQNILFSLCSNDLSCLKYILLVQF